jgi:hypothetical protein
MTPFSDRMASLWAAGKTDEFIAIANQRLACKPDDIAGLLLRLNYERDFALDEEWIKTAPKLHDAASLITTPGFAAEWSSVKVGLEMGMHAWSYREEGKINISAELGYLGLLRIAEKDGLISDPVLPAP